MTEGPKIWAAMVEAKEVEVEQLAAMAAAIAREAPSKAPTWVSEVRAAMV